MSDPAWPPTPRTGDLMSPAQVAAAFGVNPRTVTRWAKQGRLTSIRTPGGHRRYYTSDIRAFLSSSGESGAGAGR